VIREVQRDDVPDVLALVAEVLAEHGLEFGKGSPTDEALTHLPESYAGGVFPVDHSTYGTRSQGGTRIVLDTVESMSRAIAFYESHGFARDDTQIRGARCSRGYALDLR
jgi:hypothetical protein